MRVAYFGSGQFGCVTLQWLSDSEYEIATVVTQPARPAGRGRKKKSTPIAQLAEQLGISYQESENVNTPDFLQTIKNLHVDVLLVIAFGQKIGAQLLSLSNCRVINLHGSLLPKYRGAAPINWAIINGDSETGLTVIEINEQWDAGAILGQIKTKILPGETADKLHDRLGLLGPEIVEQVLGQISKGQDQPLKQNDSLTCRAPKLRKTDAAIIWSQPAQKICNLIHGMWPWPGAYCQIQQANKSKTERLTIARAEIVPSSPPAATVDSSSISPAAVSPGTLTAEMTIECSSGQLRLLEVKPENGRLMSFADYANGRRVSAGDRFLNG